jgi:glutamate dehydrogenase
MGINFVERLQRETGAAMTFIIRSYVIALHMFNMEELWQQIIQLDYKVRAEVQYRMMFHVYLLIRRATRWLLRNKKQTLDIQKTISEFAPHLNKLIENLPSLLEGTDKAAYEGIVNYLSEQGVPEYLASNIARCNALFTALDIVEASNKHGLDLLNVAKTYYLVGDRMDLNWLRESMNTYTVDNQWDELARAGFRDDLDRIQREICIKILTTKDKPKQEADIETKLNNWVEKHKIFVDRWHQLIADVKSTDSVDFVTYSVVLRELFDFAQAT